MPVLTYTADGAEPERFEFEFGDLGYTEIVAWEKAVGKNWGDLLELYWADNFEAQGALLLIMMRRTEPTLTMEQLDLRPRQLAFANTAAERAAYLDRVLALPELTDTQREAIKIVQAAQQSDEASVEVAEDPKASPPSD